MDYMGAHYSCGRNWRTMPKTSVDHLKVQAWLWKQDIFFMLVYKKIRTTS